MKRVYSNDKITVYWDSDKCMHSGRCMGQLPHVFNMAKRPWVNIESADPKEIKRAIDNCPSGALTCKLKE